jgi:hypothetical protein
MVVVLSDLEYLLTLLLGHISILFRLTCSITIEEFQHLSRYISVCFL